MRHAEAMRQLCWLFLAKGNRRGWTKTHQVPSDTPLRWLNKPGVRPKDHAIPQLEQAHWAPPRQLAHDEFKLLGQVGTCYAHGLGDRKELIRPLWLQELDCKSDVVAVNAKSHWTWIAAGSAYCQLIIRHIGANGSERLQNGHQLLLGHPIKESLLNLSREIGQFSNLNRLKRRCRHWKREFRKLLCAKHLA